MSVLMIAGYHDLHWLDRDTDGPFASAVPLGATGPEGIRLNLTKNFQEIKTDAQGPETTVDTIAQGGNCFLEFVLQELNTDVVREFLSPARVTDPPGSTPAHNEVGKVGHMAFNTAPNGTAGCLYAVPRTNTPADLAHVPGSNDRRFVGHVVGDLFETLDTTQNAIPVKFICLPFLVDVDAVWWEWNPT